MVMLYHGSNHELQGDCLLPKISFDYAPLVYATDDPAYALLRCGKFDPSDFAIKEEYEDAKHPIALIELRKDAFSDVFNTKGYIHRVRRDAFYRSGMDFLSYEPVKVVITKEIENVWHEMTHKMCNRFYFVSYADSEEYFRRKGFDLQAYLARRKERVEKLQGEMK